MIVDAHDTHYIQLIYTPMRPISEIWGGSYKRWRIGCDGPHIYGNKGGLGKWVTFRESLLGKGKMCMIFIS